MFSFSHHILVRLAAKLAGKTVNFDNYALLGDDVVIGCSKVANKYLQLLDTLGVSCSESKSHVSKDTYEFAKRWYKQGVEFTGAQVRPFMQAK